MLFTVSNLVGGVVKVSGSNATTFSGNLIETGKVGFHHDGSNESSASFWIKVEDGNEDQSAD